jgi:hypothetical protein
LDFADPSLEIHSAHHHNHHNKVSKKVTKSIIAKKHHKASPKKVKGPTKKI